MRCSQINQRSRDNEHVGPLAASVARLRQQRDKEQAAPSTFTKSPRAPLRLWWWFLLRLSDPRMRGKLSLLRCFGSTGHQVEPDPAYLSGPILFGATVSCRANRLD